MTAPEVLDELRRVDRMLVELANTLYSERPPDAGQFRGLFVSDQEYVELLERPFGETGLRSTEDSGSEHAAGTSAPGMWEHFASTFDLSELERDALLICLLPELDLKYERIFAYLQDDLTCRRPTVDLLLSLLTRDVAKRLDAAPAFLPSGVLVRFSLIGLVPPAEGPHSLLRSTVHVVPAVVRFLLYGETAPEPEERDYWAAGSAELSALLYPSKTLRALATFEATGAQRYWIQVHGPSRWTSHALASDLARRRGQALIELDLNRAMRNAQDVRLRTAEAVRDALMYDALLALYLPPNGDPDGPKLPLDWLEPLQIRPLDIVWYVPDQVTAPTPRHSDVQVLDIELPRPSYAARLYLWQRALGQTPPAEPTDIEAIAARFRLDGGQIWTAAQKAKHRSRQRNPKHPAIDYEDLGEAVRSVSTVHLGKLAHPIIPRHRWEDLVLPDDRLAQLSEMCDQLRFRHVVYGQWGFGARSARGQGLSALFAGPSGTGKTMAAEVIANDLGMPLYGIDLSGVVSKYIGETEKNLDLIFERAHQANVILLFDEADALFGKRSETKDAHDRYANIEISYLLQKIEEYDGVVILTSNLRQNLDDAFMRRLQFSVEFPFPDEEARQHIWAKAMPPELPLAEDVDLDELAARFRLSGGSIRNALVTAAFMAARDNASVSMHHLYRGVRREFQKLGKLIDEREFGHGRSEMTPAPGYMRRGEG